MTEPEASPISEQQIRNIAAIGYIWILSVPVFLFGKRNAFISHHSSQGLVFFILSVLVWFIPYVNYVAEILLSLCMLIGYYHANRGEYFHLFQTTPGEGIEQSFHKFFQKGTSTIQTLFTSSNVTETEVSERISSLSIQQTNSLAAMGYLWILSIPFLTIAEPESLIAFHARQGVVIFFGSLVFLCMGTIGFYLNIALLILSCAGFMFALSGQRQKLPLISWLSDQLHLLNEWWCKGVGIFLFLFQGRSPLVQKKSYQQCVTEWEERIQGLEFGIQDGELETEAPLLIINQQSSINNYPSRIISVFSYLFLGPFLYFVHRQDAFVRFHAVQGIILNILFLLAFFLWPDILSIAFFFASLALYGSAHAYRGQYFPIPIAYEIYVLLRKIPRHSSRTSAFTLVEIMVVVGIISVLTIALIAYSTRTDNQEVQLEKQKMELIRQQVESFKVKNGVYPNQVHIQSQATATPTP